MIYVYALLPGDAPAPDELSGLQGSPLELFVRGRVGAAVSHHSSPHIEASVDNLWKHERVVEALMPLADLLPARFGTTFKDDADLEKVLDRHHDAIADGIERVRGCVELGVRVMGKYEAHETEPVAAGASNARPGMAYMLARAAEERRRRGVEAQVTELSSLIHGPLTRISRAGALRPLLTPELLLSAAYLVERDAVERFRARIGELVEANPSVRILCTGPWPAYHFVPPMTVPEVAHG